MPASTPILLLKTKSNPQDGYADYFTSNNYTPTFIPVLEHRFHGPNLARVRQLFASGAFDATTPNTKTDHADSGSAIGYEEGREGRKYGGMIFTSQRAVEAFVKMVEEDGLPETSIPANIPLYTVGPATARSLSSLRDKYLPSATIHGAEAGNGEKLAQFILEHYNSLHPPSETQNETGTEHTRRMSKPGLLFLVGEQRRDIIPKTLMSETLRGCERIEVDEVVVYETGEMGSFERDFGDAVQRNIAGLGSDGGVLWVVVFSPSGCEGMLRVLGLGPFDTGAGGETGKRRVFVATIGPTTRDYLRERFGFEADVCAERPSPEGVGEGIRMFMENLE